MYPGDGMTVYLDGVWLLNGFIDYLLLVVSGTVTATPVRRGRILMAGGLGGLYGVLCLLPGWEFLSGFMWRGVMAFLMCFVAFGCGRRLLRQGTVLLLLAAAFFGIVMLLTEVFSVPAALIGGSVYYPVGTGTLVLTAGGAYGLMSWGLRRLGHQGGEIVPVELRFHKKSIHLTALRDTGNSLRDPISGLPVLVADLKLLKNWIPEKLESEPQGLLRQVFEAAPEMRPRLIPYKTVGVAYGLLVGVQMEEVVISGKKERVLIGLSPVSVSDGGGYQALWGGN